PAVAQPEAGATYAPKLTKEDGRIDWRQDAAAVDRQVRALTPWPGCFFLHGAETLRLLAAEPVAGQGAPGLVLDAAPTIACGQGALRLARLQRAGRAPMAAAEFLRGYALAPGETLPSRDRP
ncbi:MAG TPA: methionyl-tRNA formyltransferase, partial [Roseomonas sp.]